MKFGSIDFNENHKWTFDEIKHLVEVKYKGKIKDKAEKVAKALGVPVPEKRPKKDE